jgi:hypothetical protein
MHRFPHGVGIYDNLYATAVSCDHKVLVSLVYEPMLLNLLCIVYNSKLPE